MEQSIHLVIWGLCYPHGIPRTRGVDLKSIFPPIQFIKRKIRIISFLIFGIFQVNNELRSCMDLIIVHSTSGKIDFGSNRIG